MKFRDINRILSILDIGIFKNYIILHPIHTVYYIVHKKKKRVEERKEG